MLTATETQVMQQSPTVTEVTRYVCVSVCACVCLCVHLEEQFTENWQCGKLSWAITTVFKKNNVTVCHEVNLFDMSVSFCLHLNSG